MVPDWYRNEFTNSNLKTTENSLFLFSAHDGLIEEHSSLVWKKQKKNLIFLFDFECYFMYRTM